MCAFFKQLFDNIRFHGSNKVETLSKYTCRLVHSCCDIIIRMLRTKVAEVIPNKVPYIHILYVRRMYVVTHKDTIYQI